MAIIISFRWIDYCLEKKKVVKDFKKDRLCHLMPIPHQIPFKDFSMTCVYCCGYEYNKKFVLRELIRILGAKHEFNLY